MVHLNRLKGNFGAAHVMSLLSTQCLVRPVAVDTDVGIDLYCETLDDGIPFKHFWVQVKTGESIERTEDGARYRFDADHLNYWSRQPVPVYAALVPTQWPVQEPPAIHIIDLSTHLLMREPGATASAVYRSELSIAPHDEARISEFLNVFVPRTAARLLLRQGIIAPIETLYPQYERFREILPLETGACDAIQTQIRQTAASLIITFYHIGKLYDFAPYRHRMARVLSCYSDDHGHWEIHYALGLSAHTGGDFPNAVASYIRAHDSIRGDTRLLGQNWSQDLRRLEYLIEEARNEQPPTLPPE